MECFPNLLGASDIQSVALDHHLRLTNPKLLLHVLFML